MKIAFCHNIYDRVKTLGHTISIEKELFSDIIISVAYNNKIIENEIINNKNINKSVYFEQESHKIGCVNGLILSIQQILDQDFDIVIFSHDDVYINKYYNDVFNKNISDIYLGNYDVICRSPEKLGNYIMMESIFFSKKTVLKLFNNIKTLSNENEIDRDIRGSLSPEVWLSNLINKYDDLNKKIIKYNHEDPEYNKILGETLSFFHRNIGMRGWQE